MVHLARRTEDGIEQRSRYWIGHDARVRLLGAEVPVDAIGETLGNKRRLAGARVGYEQLLHDQIEFTHLSTFLANIYRSTQAEALGSMDDGDAFVRLVYAETLDATGDQARARQVLRAARDRLLAIAARIDDDDLRQSFLNRVPENARTLELARFWSVD